MRCTFLGNGMIVCGTSRRQQKCQVSGCSAHSSKQCDYPMPKGGTCDRYLCGGHAENVGPELDYCPAHARAMADSESAMLDAIEAD